MLRNIKIGIKYKVRKLDNKDSDKEMSLVEYKEMKLINAITKIIDLLKLEAMIK